MKFEKWEKEYINAKRFFHSKGNAKTKSKLKTKWYNEFMEME